MTTSPKRTRPAGLPGPSRPSLRLTLILALAGQSVLVLALTLGFMVAAIGIEQRLILILGLLVLVGVAIGLAAYLARRIMEPPDRPSVSPEANVAPGAHEPAALESGEGPGTTSASRPPLAGRPRQPTREAEPAGGLQAQSDVPGATPIDHQVDPRAQLEIVRRHLTALTSHLPWPFFIAHSDGKIIRHNEAAVRLWGTQPNLTGQNLQRLLAPDASSGQFAHLQGELQAGRVWHGEVVSSATQGRERVLEITAVPIRGQGDEVRTVLYWVQDVTELRQLQDLVIDMERMSTRGRMAGEIAHEINNFLTILAGNLDIIPTLLASGNQEKVEAKFAAMKQVLVKIARFSDGLMGCRDHDSEPSPCDLNRLIENLLGILKPQNRYDGIDLSWQGDPELPRVSVRVGQIQQVLVNLLNNAADAVREARGDRGRIEIRTRHLADRGQVAISVKDNGAGLSRAASERIFKERYSEKKSGHGLGLINCHRIAQSHHGSLAVESREGAGATFTLVLPKDALPLRAQAEPIPVHAAPGV